MTPMGLKASVNKWYTLIQRTHTTQTYYQDPAKAVVIAIYVPTQPTQDHRSPYQSKEPGNQKLQFQAEPHR